MSVDPRRVVRELDKFRLCHVCSSDDHVQVVPAELGVTWQDCGCQARVRVCRCCKAIASERCAHGQELRSEYGSKARTISLPGQPTRPIQLETPHKPGQLQRILERARIPRIH